MKRKVIALIVILFFSSTLRQSPGQNFKNAQLQYPRVRAALAEKNNAIKELFNQRGVQYPPQAIFLRAFKEEQKFELWARTSINDQFKLIKSYDVCASSGKLGPKRAEGDLQVPEGFYYIDRFNPVSNYHLSLGINYPNQSDRVLSNAARPGGDIFIHGNCVTIGCLPLTDDKIKEVYLIAIEAKSNGQQQIPVHIFPKQLNKAGLDDLQARYRDNPRLISFWQNLKEGYDFFERNHKLPKITVDKSGKYSFAQ
jgi:murein L,D-transpeptidase YafK